MELEFRSLEETFLRFTGAGRTLRFGSMLTAPEKTICKPNNVALEMANGCGINGCGLKLRFLQFERHPFVPHPLAISRILGGDVPPQFVQQSS